MSSRFKKITSFVLLGTVCLTVVISVWILKKPETLPFHHVRIVANAQHIEASNLKRVITDHLHGGFFSLDVNALKTGLLQLPWVYQVSFRRIWPDRLEVYVTEQKPMARWNTQSLINVYGDRFQPPQNTLPNGLPVLEGPEDAFSQLFHTYRRFDEQLLPLDVRIARMRLTGRHDLVLILNNHIRILLGRENIEQRFSRLVNLYPKLIRTHESKVAYIDCRYPNGLSVKWKQNIIQKTKSKT